jgi:DNA-binding beta-propeller fold protein YncE/plastocyanin
MIPAAERTTEQWMEYLGVRLVETRDASGDPAFTPTAGDVYFVSNESTTWGATNTRNNVVLFNAKTREVVAQSNIPDEYAVGFGSHGNAVSSDGKYHYLPALSAAGNFLLILDGSTLKVNKVYQSLGRPHHVNNFKAPDGRELIMVVDFGWNFSGSGLWVLDPAQDNTVVGGMSRMDFSGNPYVAGPENPDGTMYVTCPAAQSALRETIEGTLAKIDLATWKVVSQVPVGDPIWPEPTLDGKICWVTLGGHNMVAKVDTEKMEVLTELACGPGPWGARLSYDGTKLYTADKGEAHGYGQQGITMTVYDTKYDIVTNVVPIGKTTDHIILSPDGKELWCTSNAEHGIWVVDAATEEVTAIIKMPNDGDSHGSTFVQYSDDGAGGVAAEVVSSFTGLRGSALEAQRLFQTTPVLSIAVGRYGFVNPEVMAETGVTYRVLVENVGGTSTGEVKVDAPDLGITGVAIMPGERAEFTWTAPSEPAEFTATTNKAPNSTELIKVAAPAAETGEASGQRVIKVDAVNFVFDPLEVTVGVGETVTFALYNGDDEKHNMVGLGEDANLLSPDVDNGNTAEFDWTAPGEAMEIKVICAYHPDMVLILTVE